MADDGPYRTLGKSLDQLMDELDRGVPEGAGKGPDLIGLAFQYRVAKAQERWARISALIAASGVAVAVGAVIVAALK
jgi:hypothetical protein